MAKKNCAFRSALVKALKRVVEIWLEETMLDEMDALWNGGRRNENGVNARGLPPDVSGRIILANVHIRRIMVRRTWLPYSPWNDMT